MVSEQSANPSEAPWLRHFEQALAVLESEGASASAWRRPSAETDRLYMSVGGGDVIEVAHPAPRRGGEEDPRAFGEPVLHLGPVACGARRVVCDGDLRQALAQSGGVRCFDAELGAVMESIYGNRKERYALVRGAADYGSGVGEGEDGGDGAAEDSNKEWQLYSALMAASVLRAVVEEMPENI